MRDAAAWHNVLSIVNASDEPVIVVVSATSGTTNQLLRCSELARDGHLKEARSVKDDIHTKHVQIVQDFADEFAQQNQDQLKKVCGEHIESLIQKLDDYLLGIHTLGELTPKSTDAISSIGERLSSFMLAQCAGSLGMPAVWVDSADVMKTNSDHGQATPDMDAIHKAATLIKYPVEQGRTPILGGFYGSDSNGVITTLGRGGSDFSASLFGLAAGAASIEIWTDVSGMFTSDPRFVKHAFSIRELSFNEAAELAYFGAKVLHPSTIQPAVEKNIPVFVKNTFEPNHPGTRIYSDVSTSSPVRAIAFKKDITVITIISSRMLLAYGFLKRVFEIFEKHEVSVDLVSTSEVSISMTVDKKTRITSVVKELEEIGTVNVYYDQALISLVGRDMMKTKGVAAQAFSALAEFPIRMISQGSSDSNLSVVVENDEAIDAVQSLHDTFFPVHETVSYTS